MRRRTSRRPPLPLLLATLLIGFCPAPARASAPNGGKGLALDTQRQLAFYAVGSGAVGVLDIADPANITLLSGAIQEQGVVQDLFYDPLTQRLYIAADEGDLAIWSIQDPTHPRRISVTPLFYYNVEVPARSVEVVGNHAYVSTDFGYLHWVDVSNPASPVDEGLNGAGENPSRQVAISDNGDVYLAGPKATRFSIQSDGSLTVSGQNYAANSYRIFAEAGLVYISSGTGSLDILDGSQTTLPFLSTTPLPNISDLYAAGNVAYVANGIAGLRIYDVSDPTAPQEIALEASDAATAVIVKNNYAYLSAGERFRIVDISNPAAPFVVGSFDAGGQINIPPIANAGLSQAVLSQEQVILNGRYSYDPDGTIAKYEWKQLTGPTVHLIRSNTSSPHFKAPRVPDYPVVQLIFELTVTDDDGATSVSQTQVNVLPN